jgi:hypothetical protein
VQGQQQHFRTLGARMPPATCRKDAPQHACNILGPNHICIEIVQ